MKSTLDKSKLSESDIISRSILPSLKNAG